MSYIFDVSEENNDLLEVDAFVLYRSNGDYHGYNRTDEKGHRIHNVIFWDKREALQFKLTFNAVLIEWDESNDKKFTTIEHLLEQGYEPVTLQVPYGRSLEFQHWCDERDFAVVEEMKFISEGKEPFTVYVPSNQQALVKLTWG